MSKQFPFTKRTIEAIAVHDHDSQSREAEYADAECGGGDRSGHQQLEIIGISL
ncbi:MAG: hypothetical protein IH613_11600 [Desulfuromonadales bacterium]|nr:hypothetical protein [Desulfuromonadales bacterium]